MAASRMPSAIARSRLAAASASWPDCASATPTLCRAAREPGARRSASPYAAAAGAAAPVARRASARARYGSPPLGTQALERLAQSGQPIVHVTSVLDRGDGFVEFPI